MAAKKKIVKAKAKPAKKKLVKKTASKKTSKTKKAVAKKKPAKPPVDTSLEKMGEVIHYFPHVNAAAVKITKNSLRIGDVIHIKGHTTDFEERIDSIQLDHKAIGEGKKGMAIGLHVASRVRIGDTVYRKL